MKAMAIRASDVQGMDRSGIATGRRLKATHPGDVIRHEFIKPLGITHYRAAKAMGIQQRRLDEICAGKRAVTADTALRLERVFGMDADFWLRLQAAYDLEVARRASGRRIDAETTRLAA
jgi:addiction module HigA family antidote